VIEVRRAYATIEIAGKARSTENRPMRYLCLIHIDQREFEALPAATQNELNAAHLDYNDELRRRGQFLMAEALDRPQTATVLRIRDGKPLITDGPFAESKEAIAGFYVIEAADIGQAQRIAAGFPSVAAGVGTVEIRPARQLHVENREQRWG
jgi:hypothetical protein